MKRQRTEERKGVAPPPSFERKRRRKWKNLINEIIPQSTSIRLHSIVAVHTRRHEVGQARRGSVYLVCGKDHRVDESLSVSFIITKVSGGPSLSSAFIITAKVGLQLCKIGRRLHRTHISHSSFIHSRTQTKRLACAQLYLHCHSLLQWTMQSYFICIKTQPRPQCLPSHSIPSPSCGMFCSPGYIFHTC